MKESAFLPTKMDYAGQKSIFNPKEWIQKPMFPKNAQYVLNHIRYTKDLKEGRCV